MCIRDRLYAINFLSSQQAAEDIVQDLFATMWEKKMRLDVYKRQYMAFSERNVIFASEIKSYLKA